MTRYGYAPPTPMSFLPRALESGALKQSDEGQCLLESTVNYKRIYILLGLGTFIGSIW